MFNFFISYECYIILRNFFSVLWQLTNICRMSSSVSTKKNDLKNRFGLKNIFYFPIYRALLVGLITKAWIYRYWTGAANSLSNLLLYQTLIFCFLCFYFWFVCFWGVFSPSLVTKWSILCSWYCTQNYFFTIISKLHIYICGLKSK